MLRRGAMVRTSRNDQLMYQKLFNVGRIGRAREIQVQLRMRIGFERMAEGRALAMFKRQAQQAMRAFLISVEQTPHMLYNLLPRI